VYIARDVGAYLPLSRSLLLINLTPGGVGFIIRVWPPLPPEGEEPYPSPARRLPLSSAPNDPNWDDGKGRERERER